MITLRPYRPEDGPALLALFRDTIRRVNSRDYSPAQVAAWASDDIDTGRWFGRFAGRFVPVAEEAGHPVGFAELEANGHVDRVADSHPGPAHTDPSAGVNRPAGSTSLVASTRCFGKGETGMCGRVVGAVERELIARVLRHTHGHQGQACERLRIDRKTLRNKLRELCIVVDRVVIERTDPPEE